VEINTPAPGFPAANLLRRLMAIVYDSLVLIAILMLAALPPVLLIGGAMPNALLRIAFQLYLFGVIFLFFGWFWVHGGQTIGMRAWRLKILTNDGQTISWRGAGLRFMWAWFSFLLFGLGYLWAIVDPKGRTWHDRLSSSQVVLLPKKEKP
jgi:uncharacterized RDD family membrane protein YckC